jgi:hypothetical protein
MREFIKEMRTVKIEKVQDFGLLQLSNVRCFVENRQSDILLMF